MQTTLLIIGAGPYQVALIEAARGLGARVIAVDRDPSAPGMALADVARPVDLLDLEGIVAVARAEGVDGALTMASDVALPAVAAVTEALGLPGLRPEVIALCRDKPRCAARLLEAGLRAPEADPEGFPCVIKPVTAAGGRGVSVVRRPEELPAARAKAGRYGEILRQRFIPGRAVGCEILMHQERLAAGFLMDDQLMEGGAFPSPLGHATPSRLPEAEQAQLLAQAEAFARALGIDEGAANLDLRWDGAEATLLEINPRLGGSSISTLIHAAYGVDLPRAAALVALGRDPSPALAPTRCVEAASRIILGRGRGPVRGVERARAKAEGIEGLLSLELFPLEGRASPLGVDEWSLLGALLLTGEGAAERAARLAEDITLALHVEP